MADEVYVPFDSPLRSHCRSRTNSEETYLVDLGGNDCIGACQCTWARTGMTDDIEHGRKPVRICWHIQRQRELFLPWAIKQFRDFDQNKDDDQ